MRFLQHDIVSHITRDEHDSGNGKTNSHRSIIVTPTEIAPGQVRVLLIITLILMEFLRLVVLLMVTVRSTVMVWKSSWYQTCRNQQHPSSIISHHPPCIIHHPSSIIIIIIIIIIIHHPPFISSMTVRITRRPAVLGQPLASWLPGSHRGHGERLRRRGPGGAGSWS